MIMPMKEKDLLMLKKISATVSAMILGISTVLAVPYFATSNPVRGGGGIGSPDSGINSAQAASAPVAGTLEERREAEKNKAIANFKFTDTNLSKWDGTEQACYNSTTKVFTVANPQQFAYALHYAGSYSGSTINIVTDIDMGGSNFTALSDWTNVIFNGNNHTIYNYKSQKNGAAGLCLSASQCKLINTNFVSTYLYGTMFIGLFPTVNERHSSGVLFDNVHVKNGFHYATSTTARQGDVGAIMGTMGGNNWLAQDDSALHMINNCSSENCFSYGHSHVGGTFGMHHGVSFKNCYSLNDTIVAIGGHNGCLTSCSDGYTDFENCWASSQVFGNTSVGGLTGTTPTNGGKFLNCYSSCVVEGNDNIGGFVGTVGSLNTWSPSLKPVAQRDVQFINCYTTSMVGMNYNGNNLGSFSGTFSHGKLINCYASGEVGSISTDASDTAALQGGFFGGWYYDASQNSQMSFTNCYYDMQTTAMKNKAVGSVAPLSMTRDVSDGGVSTVTWNGIKGLTTNKMTGAAASSLFSSGYVFAPGLYPQLSTMASSMRQLDRAQSAASTSTVFCDNWSDIAPATGFDTVRDTMRPYSFSSTQAFTSNPQFSPAQVTSPEISSITWEVDGNTSPIDRSTPVVTLSDGPYYSTSLAPGIEWATVNLDYTQNGSTSSGSRRLRLIPTSFIQAGDDTRVDVREEQDGTDSTSPYDHKEGFSTTYLDATTLQSFASDNSEHSSAKLGFSSVNASSLDTATGSITGSLSLPFNSKTTSMTVTATMTDADSSGDGNKPSAPASSHIENLYGKLNGSSRFEAIDSGMYTITYKAAIPDGRYLSASKKLIVTGPWSVVYNYNYDGLLAGDRISQNSIFAASYNLRNFTGFDFDGYGDGPVRDGWSFSYWSLDPDGKLPVTQSWFDSYESRYGALAQNIDVYAQWDRTSTSASESTLTIDPTIGTYMGSGDKTVLSGEPGSRVIIDAATSPGMYDFDKWNMLGEGSGTLEPSDMEGYWIFTFGESNDVIQAGYTPLFEDKGLVIGGSKTLVDGELADGQFSFKLTPISDSLTDVYEANKKMASGVDFRGDGIDDSRQAKLDFHCVNGYFGNDRNCSDMTSAMTIRDENGELLPEDERRIFGFGTYYQQPFPYEYDGLTSEVWQPYAPEERPIEGDMSFTLTFESSVLGVEPDLPSLGEMPASLPLDAAEEADAMGTGESIVTSNGVDGAFSFADIDWASIPCFEDGDDGCRYFSFMLSEIDDDQPSIVYDTREYLVKVRTVLYNGNYLPLDIDYYVSDENELWRSIDEPVFENVQQWISMPETGGAGAALLAGVGIVFVAVGLSGWAMRKRESKILR